jgi:predicted permease
LRKGLVIAQVSLSLLLLIGAALFLQSLRNLKSLNPGFEVANLVAFDLHPTYTRSEKEWVSDYYRRVLERLNSMPGVESATIAVVPVLEDNEWDNWVTIEGYSAKPEERPDPHVQYCFPGFFKTLKIPVLLGRDFGARDVDGAPKVAIVNQKFVRRYFGGVNPVGRHIGLGIDPGTKLDMQIIGVAGDTKYENLREEIPEELYIPYQQAGFANSATAYVRAAGGPENLFNSLRAAATAVDREVPVNGLRTLADQMEISLLTERLLATLSSVFGCLATLLAAMGLYGVMAFMVARRTREIGIRMALGAGQGSVVWMVLRETLSLAAVGVAIGLIGALGVTRLIQAQLFGVQATDLLTMAAASLGIAAVSALAGYLPAQRATRIDPMIALRWE